MVEKTFWARTFLGKNESFPGTSENPMRPVLYTHPQTGETHQAHYNDRNLLSDKDYKEAGFEYFEGSGWCYPCTVTVMESQASLNGIQL